jgi:hypothetical protein
MGIFKPTNQTIKDMKQTLFFSFSLLLIGLNVNSQHIRHNPHIENRIHSLNPKFATQESLANDTTFDVKFYHLDIEVSIDSVYIQGNISYLFTSKVNGLNSVVLDLDSVFIIDSISDPSITNTFF